MPRAFVPLQDKYVDARAVACCPSMDLVAVLTADRQLLVHVRSIYTSCGSPSPAIADASLRPAARHLVAEAAAHQAGGGRGRDGCAGVEP